MGNSVSDSGDSSIEEKNMLPQHLGGGPKNLGDPDSKFLRKVEKDILILNLVRDVITKEKCYAEVQALDACGGKEGLLYAFKCRKEKDIMFKCSERWFYDEGLRSQMTEEYLKRRSYYRRTGRPGHLYKEENPEAA